MGLKADGTLWAWGQNAVGQLGLGEAAGDQFYPTQVGSHYDWVAVSAGLDYSLGVESDGTLWSWGDNGGGQLGLGDEIDRVSPTQVGTATDWAAASAGFHSPLALKSNGTLWAWGNNDFGEPGVGQATWGTHWPSPTQVGSDANLSITSIFDPGLITFFDPPG